MALDPKDIQAAIDEPPPAHVRNINVDTHIGQAPQRPYALLEDQMARVAVGYRTMEDLQTAMAAAPEPQGLPAGAPNPNEVVQDRNGEYVRYVPSQDAIEQFERDGQVMQRVRFTPRYVALTMEGARAATQEGRETDYWNGFTWLRGGYKPERDFPVMAQQAAGANQEPMVFEQVASPSDVAVLRHAVRQADLARAPLPVEPSRPATRRSSSKED
jgi:hypothetical protein